MKVKHTHIFYWGPESEQPPTCALCRFLDRVSLGEVRRAWGLECGARFIHATQHLDHAHRLAFGNDPDTELLYADAPEYYAKAWLEAFMNLLCVAPQEFLDGIPASWLTMFLRTGAEALGEYARVAGHGDAIERGRAIADELEQQEPARA